MKKRLAFAVKLNYKASMSILRTLQAHLSEHVGKADLRLFEAICAHAPSDLDANPPTLHLDKAQVLAALREIEGKDVSPEVVRSRIRHLNAAFIALGRADYGLEEAILTISSRKDSIVLKLSPAAAELIKTDKIKKAVAEALFRTLKYSPGFPRQGFATLEAARDWVHAFAYGYNTVHRHCGIQYVTPQQRHSGEDVGVLRQRHDLYEAARRQHPTRWSGDTRNWSHIREVWLNPENDRALTTKVA